MDEGLEMDHSLSHSASPTSTLSSKSSSRSQDSHYSQVKLWCDEQVSESAATPTGAPGREALGGPVPCESLEGLALTSLARVGELLWVGDVCKLLRIFFLFPMIIGPPLRGVVFRAGR